MTVGNIRIGLSGWAYPAWRGHFYPRGLAQRRELAFAASRFPALEINATFYGPQRPEIFRRWAQAVPEDFIFAVKAPRRITHELRLRDAEIPLAQFLASGVLCLGPKLGPLLWQLPPSLGFDAALIRDFLGLLPQDRLAASRLARRHGPQEGGAAIDDRPLRHAIEIRHESFRTQACVDLLREHGVALVCADAAAWPRLMDLTADFVYCRLHGAPALYHSRYDDPDLARWAARLRAWAEGRPIRDGDFAGREAQPDAPRDVFMFFDNTASLHAPADARRLMEMLGIEWRGGDGMRDLFDARG